MNLQTMLRQTPYRDIEATLRDTYYSSVPEWRAEELESRGISPDGWVEQCLSAYKKAVDKLKAIEPSPSGKAYVLAAFPPFNWWYEEEQSEDALDAFLILPGTSEYSALRGVAWAALASSEVYGKSLETYGPKAVAAAVLKEMPFDGLSPEQAERTFGKLGRQTKEDECGSEAARPSSLEDLYEKGAIERLSKDEKRKRKERIFDDFARHEEYRRRLEVFLAESGWRGFAEADR